jgi:hypothetical protein
MSYLTVVFEKAKELKVWQKAHALALAISGLLISGIFR